MKVLFQFPLIIYVIATLTSLGIMIIIDYVLGTEAEHLNAWVIIQRLFGYSTDIPDSLAIRKLGLLGATLFMFSVNAVFGFILIHFFRFVIKIIHLL